MEFSSVAVELSLWVVLKPRDAKCGVCIHAHAQFAGVTSDHGVGEKGYLRANTQLVDKIPKMGVSGGSGWIGRKVVVILQEHCTELTPHSKQRIQTVAHENVA